MDDCSDILFYFLLLFAFQAMTIMICLMAISLLPIVAIIYLIIGLIFKVTFPYMGPTLWFISLYLIAGLDIADLVHDKKYLVIVIIVELFLIVCTHLVHANNAIFYMTILTYGLYVGSFISSFFMRKSVTVCKTIEFVVAIFTMGILVEFLEDILVKDYSRLKGHGILPTICSYIVFCMANVLLANEILSCFQRFKPLSFFECLPYEIAIAVIISLPETIISLKFE